MALLLIFSIKFAGDYSFLRLILLLFALSVETNLWWDIFLAMSNLLMGGGLLDTAEVVFFLMYANILALLILFLLGSWRSSLRVDNFLIGILSMCSSSSYEETLFFEPSRLWLSNPYLSISCTLISFRWCFFPYFSYLNFMCFYF